MLTNTPAPNHRWQILLAVCTGGFMAAMDTTIVNVILPVLQKAFSSSFAHVQWVSTIYLMTVTVCILVFGRVGDIIGKKPVYLGGFFLFLVGSILCANAESIHALIACRAVQGVGASMIMALGFAIATAAFPPAERGRAMGIIGAATSTSIILGPILGGMLTAWLSWQWIFLINIPIGVFGIFMVLRFIPAPVKRPRSRFDTLGAGLLFAFLTTLLLSLSFGQTHGFQSSFCTFSMIASLFSFAAFLFRQKYAQTPLVTLSLFGNVPFRMALINGFSTFLACAGTMMLLAFYLQTVQFYDVQTTGLILAVVPLFMASLSPLSGRLTDQIGPWPVLLTGQFFLVIAYIGIHFMSHATPLSGIIFRLSLLGIGMGLFISSFHTATMQNIPHKHFGIASGLMTLARTLGQVLGVAVLGTIWAVRTQVHMHSFPDHEQECIAKAIALSETGRLVVILLLVTFTASVLTYLQLRPFSLDKPSPLKK